MFPAIVFVIASLTSFATGTSYGTMAILMPTAVPIAYALEGETYGLITMITLGSILDGAIFGDHCSPVSDTTIMSSISSSCDHMHHVRTQMPYSLTVAAMALVCGYLPAGLGMPSWIGIAVAVALMAVGFYYLPRSNPETGREISNSS
jgi:Na+/H+ antiporter NhaC